MVEGHGPAWAWREAVSRTADRIAAMSNPLLAARAADLRDVGRRVLARLAPELETAAAAEMPEGPVILVADDLTPSDTAVLDTARIVALATARGGPTSHTAILARTLGLPALVAAGEAVLDVAEGANAILDGAGARPVARAQRGGDRLGARSHRRRGRAAGAGEPGPRRPRGDRRRPRDRDRRQRQHARTGRLWPSISAPKASA